MEIDARFLAGQVDYSRWATLKTLGACEPLGREELNRNLYTSFGSLLGTLVHAYQVDSVWLSRLRGNPVATLPPAAKDLTELRSAWIPVLDALHDFAAGLTADAIVADLSYRSVLGGDFTLPVWQALLHIVNHGTYHRGQVTTMLRQLGHEAVATDMSYYFIENRVR